MVAGIALVLVVGAAWVGTRALLARDELQSAVPLATRIQDQVVAGDADGATATAADLRRRAGNAADLTSDPVWRAAEVVPLLGPNLTAVRELAAVADDISRRAVTPLTQIAGTVDLDSVKPVQGIIDVQPLVEAQPQIAAASAALNSAEARVRGIETDQTIGAVKEAAQTLHSAVTEAVKGTDILNRAAQIMPSMLGAAGPRNYILLFQNPAELRSTGGIPGALGLVHTENGRMDLTQQASTPDFPPQPSPVVPLPADTVNLYGDITGRSIQNINLTPDFTLTARLAQEMWRQQFGVQADGVISVDPVALSYLLGVTGPITLDTGDVMSAGNAVQLLLSDAYRRYPNPADQDVFFANAATAVFEAFARGNADPKEMIGALAKAGDEGRVLVWNANTQDQAVLADTTLSGSLPVSDERATRFGVYLNDATGGKMGIYLKSQVGVGRANCPGSDGTSYGVSLDLTNTAPADAATSLPSYVTASGNFGVTPGNVRTIVSVYGAPGMRVEGITRDGTEVPYQPSADSGYPVSALSVELEPGQTTQLYFRWSAAERKAGDLFAQTTPVIDREETARVRLECE
ncbi:MAG TPA: DUF4012 domain-containing protein [Glaciibacter sp.]|nr:DUF4012 domain-containing protein [Glaciibacter sp.]